MKLDSFVDDLDGLILAHIVYLVEDVFRLTVWRQLLQHLVRDLVSDPLGSCAMGRLLRIGVPRCSVDCIVRFFDVSRHFNDDTNLAVVQRHAIPKQNICILNVELDT